MKAIAPLLLLLAACASSHVPPGSTSLLAIEQASIEAGIQAWRAAGLPWSERCEEERTEIRLIYPADAALVRLECEDRKGTVTACLVFRDYDGFWLDPNRVPVILVRGDVDQRTYKHEIPHWLAICSGLYNRRDNRGDPGHDDARLWGRHGVEGAMGPQR